MLVLTTSYPLPGAPPSGPFVHHLVDHLPPDIEATVLTPCVRRHQDYPQRDNVRVRCFRYAPLPWQRLAHRPGGIPVALRSNPLLYLLLPGFLIAMVYACWRAARSVDLIHANWSVNGVLAAFVAARRRIPLVTTLRGEDVTRAGTSRLFRHLLKRCLRASARVVTVSETFRQQIAAQFPDCTHKLCLVPNGVPREALRRPPATGAAGSLRLVAVGSLIPRKDTSTLIRALANLAGLPGVRLVIVGDGPERADLVHLAAGLGVHRCITFAGAVAPGAVGGCLDRADVLVLCSRSEGRPNVVLEAMARGVPVVATRIAGVTEMIEDGRTGFLYAPGDDATLSGILRRLHADPDLRRRVAAAAQSWLVEEALFWDVTGRRYGRLYRETIAARH